jgi:hypothetical protein
MRAADLLEDQGLPQGKLIILWTRIGEEELSPLESFERVDRNMVAGSKSRAILVTSQGQSGKTWLVIC